MPYPLGCTACLARSRASAGPASVGMSGQLQGFSGRGRRPRRGRRWDNQPPRGSPSLPHCQAGRCLDAGVGTPARGGSWGRGMEAGTNSGYRTRGQPRTPGWKVCSSGLCSSLFQHPTPSRPPTPHPQQRAQPRLLPGEMKQASLGLDAGHGRKREGWGRVEGALGHSNVMPWLPGSGAGRGVG